MMWTADRGEPQSVTDAAVLANALLGGGFPPEAEFHLWEAGLSTIWRMSPSTICGKPRRLRPDTRRC